jgi:two-component system OmpR family sensor kinase
MVKNKGKIENFKNIKNKFVRENKNEGGFGIGLYIVNKICKDYGIKFQIFSENEEIVVRMDDFDVSY